MDAGTLAAVGIKYHCRSIVDDLIAQLEKRKMEEGGGGEISDATQGIVESIIRQLEFEEARDIMRREAELATVKQILAADVVADIVLYLVQSAFEKGECNLRYNQDLRRARERAAADLLDMQVRKAKAKARGDAIREERLRAKTLMTGKGPSTLSPSRREVGAKSRQGGKVVLRFSLPLSAADLDRMYSTHDLEELYITGVGFEGTATGGVGVGDGKRRSLLEAERCTFTLDSRVSHWKRIRVLSIKHAGLETLPEELGECAASLQHLILSHNKLIVLPSALQLLGDLRELRIDGNEIVMGPLDNKLTALPALRILDLSNNRVTHFPNSLWTHMGELRELYIQRNRIGMLPPELSLLRHLKILEAFDNPFVEPKSKKMVEEPTAVILKSLRVLMEVKELAVKASLTNLVSNADLPQLPRPSEGGGGVESGSPSSQSGQGMENGRQAIARWGKRHADNVDVIMGTISLYDYYFQHLDIPSDLFGVEDVTEVFVHSRQLLYTISSDLAKEKCIGLSSCLRLLFSLPDLAVVWVQDVSSVSEVSYIQTILNVRFEVVNISSIVDRRRAGSKSEGKVLTRDGHPVLYKIVVLPRRASL